MHDLISAFEAPRNFAVFENEFLFGMLHPKSQAFHQLLSFKSSSNVRQALNENTKKNYQKCRGSPPTWQLYLHACTKYLFLRQGKLAHFLANRCLERRDTNL